jgi:hypothetical protein
VADCHTRDTHLHSQHPHGYNVNVLPLRYLKIHSQIISGQLYVKCVHVCLGGKSKAPKHLLVHGSGGGSTTIDRLDVCGNDFNFSVEHRGRTGLVRVDV